MSIDDVCNVSITAATSNPTKQGFGTPLLMAYHNTIPDLLKSYSELTDLTDDGFLVTDPVYAMATKIKSQNPCPPAFYVGKRTHAYTQTISLGIVNTTSGFVYSFTVVDHTGVATNIAYTVTVGQTAAQICTAIVALMQAITAVVVTVVATTNIHMVATAGTLFNVKNLPSPRYLTVSDLTADPGIVSDIQAIETIDTVSWYGVLLDCQSKAEIEAAAAHVEASGKVFLANNSDTAITDNASTTDVAYQLKAAAYARTGVLYSASELLSYSACAWVGGMLPTNPGAGNWCYRTLAGVTADVIAGLATNAQAKNCNTYTTIAGLNVTQSGKSASGEFIDITIFVDWFKANLQARIFQILVNLSNAGKKLPYTDKGADVIRGAVMAQLNDAIDPNVSGGLASDPAPTVTIPKVATVNPIDRGNRLLPNIAFTGQLSGAINTLKINGEIAI